MRQVNRSALVPYSAQQMYQLVAEIESYPDFLPWCTGAQVHERSAAELRASIGIGFSSLNTQFTTHNQLQPPDAMTMKEQGIDTTFVNWRGFFGAPGLPEEKVQQYQDAIAKMYETEEWEEVRARNGWVNIHNSGEEFKAFLENQEKAIGDLMKKLGFL